jgi:hypothetical protein
MHQIASVLRAGREGAAVTGDASLYVPGEIYLLQPIASTVVDDAKYIPAPSSASAPDGKEDCAGESGGQISSAWRQLVKKTTSSRGSGVLASNTTRDEGDGDEDSASSNSAMDEQARAASREAEKERKRQDDQLQYEIVRVPSADSLFNGLFYYGDSMVHDHLLSAYRKALLKLVT